MQEREADYKCQNSFVPHKENFDSCNLLRALAPGQGSCPLMFVVIHDKIEADLRVHGPTRIYGKHAVTERASLKMPSSDSLVPLHPISIFSVSVLGGKRSTEVSLVSRGALRSQPMYGTESQLLTRHQRRCLKNHSHAL